MSTAPRSTDFRQLSVDDRLKLVEAVWDSLVEDEAQLPISDAHKAELDRRLDELKSHPDRVIPWEHAERELRRGQ